MGKYLLKRILYGLFSVIMAVMIIMILIYSLLDRNLVFAADPVYQHQANNGKIVYKYQKWEEYGYLDYVTYQDYLKELCDKGEISEETRSKVTNIAKKAEKDSTEVKEYVDKFTKVYEGQGYKVERLEAIMSGKKIANGGQQALFAYKDVPLSHRLVEYLTGLFEIENVNRIENIVGERGLSFTLYDPVYGGDKFSPAIMGNGTYHKYLLYFDNKFPYMHQNLLSLNLGKSYTVKAGVDIFTTMNKPQGSYVASTITYPTGLVEESADDLHSACYAQGSLSASLVYADRFIDDYTYTDTVKNCMPRIGFSFVIGIISTILAYLIGVPLGIVMARKKDKAVDKIGTFYIVFIMAVPSVAYIFMVKSFGGKAGLPTTFNMDTGSKLMYILPIVSLMLSSIASLMRWLRRYMIDQMNADYVKFAKSGGLTNREIFRKHILKNASIPIIHGVPGSIIGALVGALLTERMYVVPGIGGLLIEAIQKYDNAVIVGVALFYAVLSVVSLILGDLLMSVVDPRISFTNKAR